MRSEKIYQLELLLPPMQEGWERQCSKSSTTIESAQAQVREKMNALILQRAGRRELNHGAHTSTIISATKAILWVKQLVRDEIGDKVPQH